MSEFVIWNRPTVSLYEKMAEKEINEKGQLVSNMADEGLYGTVCRLLKRDSNWSYVISSYGYAGYVHNTDYMDADEAFVREWFKDQRITTAMSQDVLTAPTVHGACLITLSAGSLVKFIDEPETGWSRVKLLDGQEGFIPSKFLKEKRYDEELLFEDSELLIERQENAISRRAQEKGGRSGFSFKKVLDKWFGGDENLFRKELTQKALSYMGVQYRWAGRSSFGIDCSGLVGVSYLYCGVAVYRDASIVKDYPLERLELNWSDGKFDLSNLEGDALKPGDALYFPGHVAMYLGDGLYIHSTAKAGSNGVVINSLRPEHELFRQDLLDSLYACAGLRIK